MQLCLRGMYSMYLLASIGLLSLLGGLPLFSQESAKTAETAAALYAPYWRLGDRFETTIMVNNTRPKDVTITTYVYTTSGERLPSISFTVGAMDTKTFSLGEILVNRTNERTGYVELQFYGAPVDIAAQVLIEDQAQHLRWNHVFEPKKRYLSSRYEGVFMGSGEFEGATLALTNVSSNTVVASFSLAEGARQTGKAYQLPPHTQRVIALSDYLARSQAPGRRAVGISISHSGSPGDVIAQGLASLGRGGAYNIHVADSARLKSSSLISTVLALPGAHTPFLAIRNTSSEHSGISLIAHYKPVKGQNSQELVLQQLALDANTSVVVDLRESLMLLPASAEDIGLEMTASNSQGQPLSGRIVADLLLLTDEGRQVIQVVPKDPAADAFPAFSQPWDISGTNTTVITLTNPNKTDRVGLMLSLHYQGGQYSYDARMGLAPGETKHISVNDIRDQQLPGVLGQKMPRTASRGQVLVSAPGPHDVLLAQSIVTDPTKEVSLTSSCNTCPPSASYYTVSPTNTVDGQPGDQVSLTPVCHLDNGTQSVVSNPYAIDWSPGNSSIASVSASWGSFLLNFGSYGSTTVDATSHDCVNQYNFATGQCDCTVTPLPVQTPIQARTRQAQWAALVSDTNPGNPICGYAIRERVYQGLDAFGYISYTQNWRLNETITSISSCATNPTTGGTPQSVNFDDVISIGCSNAAACAFQTDQTYSMAKPGLTLVQVPGKNCITAQGTKMSDTDCRNQPSHTGWHVSATGTAVTVTDNP